jgi:hypothetical protein
VHAELIVALEAVERRGDHERRWRFRRGGKTVQLPASPGKFVKVRPALGFVHQAKTHVHFWIGKLSVLFPPLDELAI